MGLLLKNNIPTGALRWITFAIFAAFGVLNAHEAAGLMFKSDPRAALWVTAGVTALFAVICLATVLLSRGKEKK